MRAHVCSGCQIEKVVDELNLPKKIISCHPSNLPLPAHVDCFVALNRSPGRLEFSSRLFQAMVKYSSRFPPAISRRFNAVMTKAYQAEQANQAEMAERVGIDRSVLADVEWA